VLYDLNPSQLNMGKIVGKKPIGFVPEGAHSSMVEQFPLKESVGGSSPPALTKNKFYDVYEFNEDIKESSDGTMVCL
jgi:hypothetical protein